MGGKERGKKRGNIFFPRRRIIVYTDQFLEETSKIFFLGGTIFHQPTKNYIKIFFLSISYFSKIYPKLRSKKIIFQVKSRTFDRRWLREPQQRCCCCCCRRWRPRWTRQRAAAPEQQRIGGTQSCVRQPTNTLSWSKSIDFVLLNCQISYPFQSTYFRSSGKTL